MGTADARVLSADRLRDAATVIVLRDAARSPRVLMGQRGRAAAFLPDKFVFPGGAVDAGDGDIALARPLGAVDRRRLDRPGEATPEALAAAALRELWEETGQLVGRPGDWPDAPPDWQGYRAAGLRPDASALRYVFRAITPPGYPRRFDARFFVLDAAALSTAPDDFLNASDELAHLQWVAMDEARDLDLPFITSVVLAELAARLPDLGPPPRVPFFRDDAPHGYVLDEAQTP